MNAKIIEEISLNLNVKIKSVENTLKLLSENCTVPFIARYRKELTGGLDEEQIRSISESYNYELNLQNKKENVIKLITEKGLMTDELKQDIMNAKKLVEVEDLYRPYVEKKKTKATEAIKNGLEGLSKEILSFPLTGTMEDLAKKYLNENVKTIDEAVTGAGYIISEIISDNAEYRQFIRKSYYYDGILKIKKKKNAVDENSVYEMYYEYEEEVKRIKPHRILAINRGEKENILSVNIEVNMNKIENYLSDKIIKNTKSFVCELVLFAIKDALKRLILPSIEREIRNDLTDKANIAAIDNFSKNLGQLLMTPPMKEKKVLGFDPAYRTGCKLAALDITGKVLEIKVIYPHEPHNKKEESKKILIDLIKKYQIDIVAIGNGTASRESEAFVADVIKSIPEIKVEYIIVSEAGASVYSASKLAISEFPDLHVEERSAISIGRRLQDPLAELVKIDPESIGVGLYQHDVPNKELKESLDFVVLKSVNSVGVNINNASYSLLSYVSGLTKSLINKILEYRDKIGKIKSREELLQKKILSPKSYEQAIGFLRITDGDNYLDKTSIHPESYDKTIELLKHLDLDINCIGTDLLINKLSTINVDKISKELNIDLYTLNDIIEALQKPGRDPRDEYDKPILKSDILHLEDLSIGMKLQGTVRNVIDFGCFVDIGLKNDGLIHISKLSKEYIKHPSDVVSVGQIIDCYVLDINPEKKKVSLSLLPVE